MLECPGALGRNLSGTLVIPMTEQAGKQYGFEIDVDVGRQRLQQLALQIRKWGNEIEVPVDLGHDAVVCFPVKSIGSKSGLPPHCGALRIRLWSRFSDKCSLGFLGFAPIDFFPCGAPYRFRGHTPLGDFVDRSKAAFT